jgi:phosphoribosylaminoimidazolecarboxamide formyltransferase/IMP cyclohydrolase/phosphoribosylaminoimidazolecarboxamide formyltransferase
MLAVLGVSDKRNIDVLAGGLLDLGWDVVATEGTHRLCSDAGLKVGRVADLAGVPTLLGGRVKTLTVSVMAGILARDTESDVEELSRYDITRVDLVACNYYRLPAGPVPFADFREKVDIGGPAMLRAAAKNCAHVIPLSDPDDYAGVLEQLAAGEVPMPTRLALAAKAFRISADYEEAVAALYAAASA